MPKTINKLREVTIAVWKRIWHYLRKPSFTDYVVGIATVVIAVATWKTYREVQQGGQQTTQIVAAAQQIQSALDTANIRNGRAFRRTLDQSRIAMDASNRQSKAALDATIANAKRDQRAWVSMPGFILDQELGDVDTISIKVILANTGRTPALSMTYTFDIGLFEGTSMPRPDWSKAAVPRLAPIMLPPQINPIGAFSFSAKRLSLPKPAINEYLSKRADIYIWVRIDYRDIFDTPHWAESCAKHTYGDDATSFRICGGSTDDTGNHQPN
jgi:hypothetical protein